MNVWVVGNGQSRQGFALNHLKDWTIGCNAVYRDFLCDEFVAVDMRMVNEMLHNNVGSYVYTRQDWANNYSDARVRPLPDLPFTGDTKADQPFHWNSGPYAILLAAKKNPEYINLLGFDLWSKDGLVNNLYKGTPNYAKSESTSVSPELWIYQLGKLFRYYDQINFVQYQAHDWQIPDEWKDIKNLTIKYFSV